MGKKCNYVNKNIIAKYYILSLSVFLPSNMFTIVHKLGKKTNVA